MPPWWSPLTPHTPFQMLSTRYCPEQLTEGGSTSERRTEPYVGLYAQKGGADCKASGP